MKEQEVQTKGVVERRGLKQPSTRHLVRNASEHDSARQAGEPASQERNQVRQERNQWHSQSTGKDGHWSLSGGWWWNGSRSDERLTRENHVENETGVHSAERAKRADKEPGYVEVRASIVAKKRGNARGAKGRRKIERIRSAGRKKPPLVINLLRARSIQGWRTLSREGSTEEYLPANTDPLLAGCRKRQSDTREKQARCRRTSNFLVEVPRFNSACQSHCRPYRLESRMRENRLSGSEGGAAPIQSSLPLSFIQSLRDGSCGSRDTTVFSTARLCGWTPASISPKFAADGGVG